MIIRNISGGGLSLSDISDQDNFLLPGEEREYTDTDSFKKSAKSGAVKKFIDLGYLQVIQSPLVPGDLDYEDELEWLLTWVRAGDVYIQFQPTTSGDNPYSGAPNADVDIALAITNGVGVADIFNNGNTVVVTITGGTAAGKVIKYLKTDGTWTSYAAGPVTVPFINGIANIKVKGTSAGDITLGLSGGTTSLDRTDTATVTLA